MPPHPASSFPPSAAARAAGTMGCCCRLLLALLLLLPAGLGDDPTASPLVPASAPPEVVGTAAGPGSGGTAVPAAAPHQPAPLTATGPTRDEVSSRPAEVDDPNGGTVAMLSPASIPTSTVAAADTPPVAFSSVPPALETAPGPRTAHNVSVEGGTTDLGTPPSPTGTPSPSSSSPRSSTPYSSPGTVLSPPTVPSSTTQSPMPMKDVPSPGTMAVASSLAMEPTSPSVTVASPTEDTANGKSTPATGVTMEEVPRALSAGSIVAITVVVIVVVVLVFGAAYLKIRHSSYGRLLDDHDYGSWGNYNNPLYDDS
ncbi:LOW QUALITY PROTEIN: prostate androgen-regulated mucin-like protein 1 [Cygnus olor]|uniref:LOW QUALITY PROTEIN: prostate androgen-regulated mucin-like protein 1 n=1 Tax=Cygnus olor TaxID=8869 RepID=UPI001ADE886E|nr:LOW QUALITY PROTEIN: prostate androgen-regulated mucin-like protein 1 [Cygnus olor]